MLATLSDDQSFPVTTGSNGTCLVIISTASTFISKAANSGSNLISFPYYYCSTASNTNPFSVISTINYDGPFVNYASQSVGSRNDATII